MHQRIIILDFGSQFTQLIARRVREAGVYSEIYPCTLPAEKLAAMQPHGIILSGSPWSVYDEGAPRLSADILSMTRSDGSPMPILGICYGLFAMADITGGNVARASAMLGITRQRAYRMMEGHDVDLEAIREQESGRK